MKLIVSTAKGSSGIYVSSTLAWTPEVFFNTDPNDLPSTWWSRFFYTITVDSSKPLELLTKKRLQEEFSRFSQTKMYHYLMNYR